MDSSKETEVQDENPEIKEKNIFEDLLGDLVNLDKGLPATVITMVKSPNLVIDSYFADEKKFVNPFRYTILILAVTTLIGTLFVDYEVVMQRAMEMGSSSTSSAQMEENLRILDEESGLDVTGYMTAMKDLSVAMMSKFNQIVYIVVMAPLIAFSSRLFFKKKKSKFSHHYVMLLYTSATFAIFGLLTAPLMMSDIPLSLFTFISSSLMIAFIMYVQVNYLKLKGFTEYAMSFLSCIIGYLLYFIATLIIQIVGAFILVLIRS